MIRKLLLKLLGNSIYQPGQIEIKRMQEWLFKAYGDEGFKHYYTMRKKHLYSYLALQSVKGEDRWIAQGRLEELKSLSANITKEALARKVRKN